MTILDWNLENLYICPGFFGELSEENAKEILREAFQNRKTGREAILFLKTVTDDTYWKRQLHHCPWILSRPESILFHGKLLDL